VPILHFTDVTIRSLKEGVYFDDHTPSFAVRVGKNRKTWLVVKQPNRTKVRLGFYPQTGLAEARRRALVALGSPHHPVAAPAFPIALDEFLAQDRWKPRTKYEITRTLRRHFRWTKALDKITHHDILAVADSIKAKSERAHALKDIRTFFNWCVPRYLPQSPCNGLRTQTSYTPRFRVLSDDEIRRIWSAAQEMGAYGVQVLLLITTGQRANQISSLKREWIDMEKRLIKFPPECMKSNREHVIPYGDLTATLLDAHKPSSYQGKKKRLLDQKSKTSQWVLHDLRRYYSSTQRKLKTPIDITEAILSHLSGSRSEIQRIYDLYDRLEEMRQATNLYENHLKSLVG
jgi:integrase